MGKLENKILDMKFLALLVAVVVAADDKKVTDTKTDDTKKTDEVKADPPKGKAAKGQPCDSTKADMGCDDTAKLRCQTAPDKGKNTCIDEADCGKTVDSVETTGGAAKLAAGVLAALAVASTM